MTPTPPDTVHEVRALRPEDGPAVRRAFDEAFAAVDPGFRPREESAWRWRFLDNPAGTRAVLALAADGRVLAQYAGLPQRARVEGEPATLTQAVDSFCVPTARALGRRGAFTRAGETFAAEYCGARADRWVWGLPVPAARRVGERTLRYRSFGPRPVLELTGPLRGSVPGLQVEEAPWAALPELESELGALHGWLAEHAGAFALRDASALAWRYAHHPGRRYRLLVAREGSGGLAGFAVLGEGPHEGREGLLWCDGVAPPAAEAALAAHAAALAEREGWPALVAQVPPWWPGFLALQELGFRVRPGRWPWAGRSFDPERGQDFWESRWYHTPGDTDLC
jgi:hypothetical protein